MPAHIFRLWMLAGALGLLAGSSRAADNRPFVHPLFSDHMVLQRGMADPVWGWAAPGTKVTVSLGDQTATATAGKDGKWLAKLGPLEAGGPHTLTVAGPQTVTFKDVLVGDVWICSGQSNMEWPMAATNNAQEEIKTADHPQIRLFTVPKKISGTPQETVNGSWTTCRPDSIPGFTAVGYFFGRELQQRLDVPIGLIHTSWGGTVAEAWTSAEALSTMDDFRAPVEAFQQQVAAAEEGEAKFREQMHKWWRENDPGSANGLGWADPALDASDWKTMAIPGNWESRGLNFDGIVWFRTQLEVPATLAGKDGVLELGPIDDRDTTWINGQEVGAGDNWNQPRKYKVPGKLLKAGTNQLAVRVLDTGGGGGLHGQPQQMKLIVGNTSIPLAGDWKYKVSTPLNKVKPAPQSLGGNPNVVTVLYNGMLAPLVPYGIKGAIWYQGESNAGRAMQYRTLLPTMIKDWRTRFGQQFPFFVVQLANFTAVQKQPVESGWAELREAQLLTAQKDPKTGLAVIIDIGEAGDIHPRNKQDVGKRLALQALDVAYGKQDLVSSGPELVSAKFEGGKAVLKFKHVGGGLVAHGDKLTGFAIAGEDKKFVWGQATISGDTITVTAPEVSAPVAVRYGWANNPTCNLFNKEGLPATPFRTDVE